MKTAILLIMAGFMAGCASLNTAIDKGAEANDAAVQAAEFAICNGASIGSIRRSFGNRPEVWRELCADEFILED